jgi:hypothetical protein
MRVSFAAVASSLTSNRGHRADRQLSDAAMSSRWTRAAGIFGPINGRPASGVRAPSGPARPPAVRTERAAGRDPAGIARPTAGRRPGGDPAVVSGPHPRRADHSGPCDRSVAPNFRTMLWRLRWDLTAADSALKKPPSGAAQPPRSPCRTRHLFHSRWVGVSR